MDNSAPKKNTRIINIIFITLIFLVIAVGGKVLWKRNVLVKLRVEQLESYEKEVAEYEAQLENSGNEYHRLQMDKDTIESVARNKLNLVGPGEIVLQFSENKEITENSLTE